jgi:hypothetical protein
MLHAEYRTRMTIAAAGISNGTQRGDLERDRERDRDEEGNGDEDGDGVHGGLRGCVMTT